MNHNNNGAVLILTSARLVTAGIVDIGIEYCETVCSQHHTVWEDPRGSRRRFERIQRVGLQDMCSRVELILKNHKNLCVPINTILTNCR